MMSSDADKISEEDAKLSLSPSAYLQAPSSSQTVVEQPGISQLGGQGLTGTEDDPNDDELDSEEDRENRFTGPASTWRGYIADERALAASLDQERANDLSVHLYNTHALKSRLYEADTAAQAKPWQSKEHWMTRGEDGKLPWQPDQHWTAWPLPAGDVPRKGEGFGQDVVQNYDPEGTFRKVEAWRPGADLQEELEAKMLRKAKQRFTGRTSASADAGDDLQGRGSQSVSRSASRPVSAASSRRSSDTGSAMSAEKDVKLDRGPVGHSVAPTILADDDQASRLLRPLTIHVMSKLDDLLIGLHKSRQSSVANQSSRSSKDKTDHRPQKRKRATTVDIEAELDPGKPKKDSTRDYKKHPSGTYQGGTRDWSEVLGMAALTGWDPSVVDRAAKRCAALFGEKMSLRTMPETVVGASTDRIVEYTPSQIPDLDVPDSHVIEDVALVEDELCCPEASCQRHCQPFEQRWRLREHLKKVHRYTLDDLGAMYNSEQPALDVKEESEDGMDEDKAVANECGAVRIDGFLQPIEVSFGRGKDLAVRKAKTKKQKKGGVDPRNDVSQDADDDAAAGAEPEP